MQGLPFPRLTFYYGDMNCSACSSKLEESFNFCPNCGKSVRISQSPPLNEPPGIPERYLVVAREFEELTNIKLTKDQLSRFAALDEVGKLSVNDSERRKKAGLKVRIENADGTYILNVSAWLVEMYETPNPNDKKTSRVWITPGGVKYHAIRECRGLQDGQNYASWKGKDTYVPQFVTRKDAKQFYGKSACEVCNPG